LLIHSFIHSFIHSSFQEDNTLGLIGTTPEGEDLSTLITDCVAASHFIHAWRLAEYPGLEEGPKMKQENIPSWAHDNGQFGGPGSYLSSGEMSSGLRKGWRWLSDWQPTPDFDYKADERGWQYACAWDAPEEGWNAEPSEERHAARQQWFRVQAHTLYQLDNRKITLKKYITFLIWTAAHWLFCPVGHEARRNVSGEESRGL